MKALANLVHVSFRRVERAADWLTGSAGPLFVSICLVLVLGGIWTFFTTMFLELAPVPNELSELFHTYSPAHIALGLLPTLFDAAIKTPLASLRFFFWLFFCLFIVYSIGWHYYMACTEAPGSVLEGLGDGVNERRSGPGSSIWWARYRTRAAVASGPPIHDLASTASHIAIHEPTEAAAPVRVASIADLKKLNSALDGLDSNRTRSASVTASNTPLRPPSDRVNSIATASTHRSSTSSEAGTPRLSRTDLPLFMHDVDPFVTTPAPLAEEGSEMPFLLNEVDEIDEDDEDLFPIAGMCRKCPSIPLSKALAVLPPELRKVEKQIRAKRPAHTVTSKLSTEDQDEGEAEVREWLGEQAAEKFVPPPKPERSHHCRACKTCTLKFDHHCPWLNQCVGLGNERYFVLFMAWLSFGCGIVTFSGFNVVRRSVSFTADWPYPYTPRVLVLLLFVLAVVMGFALAVMAGWQLVLVSRGETSVESNDNGHYRELAKQRGQDFVNVYDVGPRRNLELFFNVGAGSSYPYYTIFLPMRVPPYSDGWHWAKRRGLNGKHAGIQPEEQLTDEEFEDEHYENDAPSSSQAGK
ncbi:hypothetical protein BCV70DRAFT_44563 [Testicularia cyperi]|uniref:Palmitoyltransferase n=1 Tax=Testicularia cyperi TaxID=1882483 RepID=A0A317XK99_9BASI|nr:hypothetical protein BCV70DRAFT_44563 [Testicularia cyperi]